LIIASPNLGNKLPLKGAWTGSHDPFKMFGTQPYLWNGWS